MSATEWAADTGETAPALADRDIPANCRTIVYSPEQLGALGGGRKASRR